jgi:hypothetical protein
LPLANLLLELALPFKLALDLVFALILLLELTLRLEEDFDTCFLVESDLIGFLEAALVLGFALCFCADLDIFLEVALVFEFAFFDVDLAIFLEAVLVFEFSFLDADLVVFLVTFAFDKVFVLAEVLVRDLVLSAPLEDLSFDERALVFMLAGLFALFDFARVDCEPGFARSEVALAIFLAELVRPKPRSSSSAPADWEVDP